MPPTLTLELDRVAGPLEAAEDMASDARYNKILITTEIPDGALCESLSCALILAGGRVRGVAGQFRLRAIGYGYSGDNAYTLGALDKAGRMLDQLGVSPGVVEPFKHAPPGRSACVSHNMLASLSLVTERE